MKTCSKLLINELWHCKTKSDNVPITDIEQTLIVIPNICHVEHNIVLIKL